MLNNALNQEDALLYTLIQKEAVRQEENLSLIASENYASRAVLEAQGSILTNKYAEGYPGNRYYGGCAVVDEIEQLAIERAKSLFQIAFANVQPHAGSQANMAAYMALIQPGDTILGMRLDDGGHLTHGASVSFSGKNYRAFSYGVDPETALINYEEAERLAQEHKPRLIICGYSAYPRLVDWKRFRAIADSVGAYLLADIAHIAGLVATKLHPSPVGIADIVTTTTHKTLRGPRGGLIMTHSPEISQKINRAIFPGLQGGPLVHVIAGKAVAFLEAAQPEFVNYQQQVIRNAQMLAKTIQAGGYQVLTGGTDNHLFTVSLLAQNITGKDAQMALEKAGIICNKESIPRDPQSPFVTSGIRLGSPAITTRGFKEKECEELGKLIVEVLQSVQAEERLQKIKAKVEELCKSFPIYS